MIHKPLRPLALMIKILFVCSLNTFTHQLHTFTRPHVSGCREMCAHLHVHALCCKWATPAICFCICATSSCVSLPGSGDISPDNSADPPHTHCMSSNRKESKSRQIKVFVPAHFCRMEVSWLWYPQILWTQKWTTANTVRHKRRTSVGERRAGNSAE